MESVRRRRNRVNGDHVQVRDGFGMGFASSETGNALYGLACGLVQRVSVAAVLSPRLDIEAQDAIGLLARSGVGDGHGKLMLPRNGHP